MNPLLNWTGTSALPCLTGQECADWCATQNISIKQYPYLLALIAFLFLMGSAAIPSDHKLAGFKTPMEWMSYGFIIAAIITDMITA